MDNKVFDTWNDINGIMENSQEDLTRFINGNKAAGTRLRKHMQNIKHLAQEVRLEVQQQKNSVTV
tara:strand:+ start:175 stop:369 length:195 start_codon:yes stop_codon:yes gene_type:complete